MRVTRGWPKSYIRNGSVTFIHCAHCWFGAPRGLRVRESANIDGKEMNGAGRNGKERFWWDLRNYRVVFSYAPKPMNCDTLIL